MTTTEPAPPVQSAPVAAGSIGLPAIAAVFFELGVISFGGGLSGWMHRAFVVRRRWIDEATFFPALAFAQLMPGANVVNLAILIGQRLRGAPGAVAAVCSLLVGPCLILAGLMAGYAAVHDHPSVLAALAGMAAGAVGLTVATGVLGLRKGPKGVLPMGTALFTVIAIAGLHLPTVAVVGVLAPASLMLQLVLARRGGGDA